MRLHCLGHFQHWHLYCLGIITYIVNTGTSTVNEFQLTLKPYHLRCQRICNSTNLHLKEFAPTLQRIITYTINTGTYTVNELSPNYQTTSSTLSTNYHLHRQRIFPYTVNHLTVKPHQHYQTTSRTLANPSCHTLKLQCPRLKITLPILSNYSLLRSTLLLAQYSSVHSHLAMHCQVGLLCSFFTVFSLLQKPLRCPRSGPSFSSCPLWQSTRACALFPSPSSAPPSWPTPSCGPGTSRSS